MLLTFFSIISLNFVCAQTEQVHLTFKGIPIDGTVEAFSSQLEKLGYEKTFTSEDGNVVLKGNFAGQESRICVLGTPSTKTVWKIGVYWGDKHTSWSSIRSSYDEIKETYETKYGKPANDYHFFTSPYELGDGYEMTALKVDKCFYFTAFDFPEGHISISMGKSCEIMIGYEDEINSNLKSMESEARALNDI